MSILSDESKIKATLTQSEYLMLLGLWTVAMERRKSLTDLEVLIGQVLGDEGPDFWAAQDLIWANGHLDAWLRNSDITIEEGIPTP